MLMVSEHMMVKSTTEQEERQKESKNQLQPLNTDQKVMIVKEIMEVHRTVTRIEDMLINIKI